MIDIRCHYTYHQLGDLHYTYKDDKHKLSSVTYEGWHNTRRPADHLTLIAPPRRPYL